MGLRSILGNLMVFEGYLSFLALIALIEARIIVIPNPLPLYFIVQIYVPVKNEKDPHDYLDIRFLIFFTPDLVGPK